jgi:hypothetical protein
VGVRRQAFVGNFVKHSAMAVFAEFEDRPYDDTGV